MDSGQWFTIIGYIHLIAGVQGLFLTVLLISYPAENRTPNRILSLLIFAFSMIILGTSLGATGLYEQAPHLIRLGDPMVLLLGPSLLLYVTAIRIGKVPRVQWAHLLPFLLYAGWLLPFYFSAPEVKLQWAEVALSTSGRESWFNLLKALHAAGYFIWVFLLTKRHARQMKGFSTDLKDTDLAWIRSLTGYLIFLASTAMLFFLLSGLGWMETKMANGIIGFVMAVLVYVMGYSALLKPRVFGERDYPAWQPISGWMTIWGGFIFNPEVEPEEQYVREELALLEKLQAYMEQEKPYRDSDLDLAGLASQTNIPQYLLSRIINQHLELNFFDFVNSYRIEEVCERLVDPSQRQFTILALAMDAGFNSKSSFYTAFRKAKGVTPSQYRKQHQSDS
ncbi:MAG: helix-turn-helix domain-containing protein [Bacteroidota bacterium]